MSLLYPKSGTKSIVNGKGQSYSALPKNSSKVNISDEVARSGAWLHVNHSKSTFQEYLFLSLKFRFKMKSTLKVFYLEFYSGTEMTSYRKKDYGDSKASDDENEPLTFLSGTKRIQIQVIVFFRFLYHFNLVPYLPDFFFNLYF